MEFEEFEWDAAKRLSNLGKHGIDFLRARAVFDGLPDAPSAVPTLKKNDFSPPESSRTDS
ncbi:MAG: BrnT family toxin [Chloroflexota bacterium]|nr:BrnT family toxin [Chloroflexota bacterium]